VCCNSYIKKLIEDANLSEETVKLLQFCCWENPHFSRTVLSELLWQIAYAYCHELRHHMDLLLSMLLIEDSWQSHRIHNALKGIFCNWRNAYLTLTALCALSHCLNFCSECTAFIVLPFCHSWYLCPILFFYISQWLQFMPNMLGFLVSRFYFWVLCLIFNFKSNFPVAALGLDLFSDAYCNKFTVPVVASDWE
jgi:hypothetical protein